MRTTRLRGTRDGDGASPAGGVEVGDDTILVDEALPAGVVRGTIRSAAPETLVSIVEFDRYQGKGIPEEVVRLLETSGMRPPAYGPRLAPRRIEAL